MMAITYFWRYLACLMLFLPCVSCGESAGATDAGAQIPDVLHPDVNLTDAGMARYSVGGQVNGLQGTGLVLLGDNTETLSVSPNGGAPVSFQFPTLAFAGLPYAVVVQTQPSGPTQNCSVMNGSGTVPHHDVTNIVVNCTTNDYFVGGTVSGTEGSPVVLTNNSGD